MIRIAALTIVSALISSPSGATMLSHPPPEAPYPDYTLEDAVDAWALSKDPNASALERIEARRILRVFCSDLPARPRDSMERETQKLVCD